MVATHALMAVLISKSARIYFKKAIGTTAVHLSHSGSSMKLNLRILEAHK
jgi:hypothetical protein